MNSPTARTSEPELVVLPDPDAVAAEAAERIADMLRESVEARGRADWATTGGSAPVGIYRLLAVPPLRDRVPWQAVHLWWGDDRFVPRDHPQSNVMPANAVLLALSARAGLSGSGEDHDDVRTGRGAGAPIPVANIHPFPIAAAIGAGHDPAWAASGYETELRASEIAVEGGWPVFDLVLIGIGPDGHLLSVFPGSPALDEASAWALPIPAPTHVEPHVARVTLNPRVLEVARRVLVVAHGEAKAAILGAVLGPDRDPRRWPAQLARRRGASWLVDRAAAGRLPGPSAAEAAGW